MKNIKTEGLVNYLIDFWYNKYLPLIERCERAEQDSKRYREIAVRQRKRIKQLEKK